MRFPDPFPRLLPLTLAVASLAHPRLAHGTDPDQLADLSVEQLLDLKVTSVARREETVSHSPAAIYVITQEDIRRSGARSIPDALRLAPGMDVAQVDAHTWAVSSRGFNSVFANKLLVLIDGRSVYTPLFSGVFWDAQDVVIEDIDRIEIIRGPGAALWGANAVNGVINITTKRVEDTQGGLITTGGGNEERAFTTFRFGGRVNDDFHYRIFGKATGRDDSELLDGGAANDGSRMGRIGFRVDWTPAQDTFTLQGEAYHGLEDAYYERLRSRSPFTVYDDYSVDHISGGNILGRWTRDLSSGGQVVLQTYYDRTNRDAAIFGEWRDTFDVDFQHRFRFGDWQTIVWGGGYRATSDRVRNSFDLGLSPQSRTTNLYSAFLQDEISIVKNRLGLTLGSKIEHNDFTGFEFQPSGRLLWTPAAHHSVWASVSRAVQMPSRIEDDLTLRQGPVLPPGALYAGFPPYVPPSPAVLTSVSGRRGTVSEEEIAYEIGYRIEPTPRLSFDLALFYNDYQKLGSFETDTPVVDLLANPPHIGVHISNRLKGETYGGEIAATWQAASWWKLQANYSLLYTKIHFSDGGLDAVNEHALEGSSPRYQASLRSSIDLPRGFEFDAGIRYVDALPVLHVPAYVAVDVRLGWHISDSVELSVVGRNLLDRRHAEFLPTNIGTGATEVERSIYGSFTIRF